jgi:transcriptional regulator
MYIPKRYQLENVPEALAFMKRFSFATIVTVKDNFPTATHLPFTVTEDGGSIILTSHFAKANKQWQEIVANEVLVIFTDPHAYISPKHYENELNVPTWNYISVHAYGRGVIIENTDTVFRFLEEMIDSFDEGYKKQWNNLPLDYKSKYVEGHSPFSDYSYRFAGETETKSE